MNASELLSPRKLIVLTVEPLVMKSVSAPEPAVNVAFVRFALLTTN
jgi:hypothetical protein